MKRRKIIVQFLISTLIFSQFAPLINVVYADGMSGAMDIGSDFNMDFVMQQSLSTIENTHIAVEDADFTNDLNMGMIDQMDFFFSEVEAIQDMNFIDSVTGIDSVSAIDDGVWAQDFNDFYDSPVGDLEGYPNVFNDSLDAVSGVADVMGLDADAGVLGLAASALLAAQDKDEESSEESTDNSDIIAYAKTFLGLPYIWGGTTPKGFDCSGYMQYIFKKFGVTLPRVARDQQKAGVHVDNDKLQPGDLVFWGRPATHVGMYIGNGEYIHSPKTGDVIKISKIKNRPITNARRVRTVKTSSSGGTQSGGKFSNYGGNKTYNLSAADRNLAERLLAAEARGEDYKGQLAVASVLANRVESKQFPNSISGVINQKGQYSPVSNGQINKVKPNSTQKKVISEVFDQGIRNVPRDVVYFCYPEISSSKWMINNKKQYGRHGVHAFFYK